MFRVFNERNKLGVTLWLSALSVGTDFAIIHRQINERNWERYKTQWVKTIKNSITIDWEDPEERVYLIEDPDSEVIGKERKSKGFYLYGKIVAKTAE